MPTLVNCFFLSNYLLLFRVSMQEKSVLMCMKSRVLMLLMHMKISVLMCMKSSVLMLLMYMKISVLMCMKSSVLMFINVHEE